MIFCADSFRNLMEFNILCCQIEHQELSKLLVDFQIELFIKLKDIQNENLSLPSTPQETVQIAEFAFEKGAIIFEKYFEALVHVPLQDVLENMVDFITEVVIMFPEQAKQWINSCLVNIPLTILSEAEKRDFCIDFEHGSDSEPTIHKSFQILCRRSKQAMFKKLG